MGNPQDKEETARRKVIQEVGDLRNILKIASVVVWVTKSGTRFFGTNLFHATYASLFWVDKFKT